MSLKYNTKKGIEDWLSWYKYIKNYSLVPDSKYGYVVDVDDVRLYPSNDPLPFKFNVVTGHFFCDRKDLSTLEGCPDIVGKDFRCCFNNLTNLEFCPKIIRRDFYCSSNNLDMINLFKFLPSEVKGNFWCINNPGLENIQNINSLNAILKVKETIEFKNKLQSEIYLTSKNKCIKI